MEEDAEGMDRFDMDGDFLGGRSGRDGDFFYEGRRQRALQTRDDALYGVFAEGDSDYDYDSEEDEGSRPRKRRRDELESDFTRPVQFVSKGMPEGVEREEQRPGLGQAAFSLRTAAAAEEDAEDNQDLPTGFGQRIAEGARARREEKERQHEAAKRRRQASSAAGADDGKPAPAPGSVESNTKVAKMMAMMGHKRGMGLGKNAQGITAPLETIPRRKNAGLGSVEEFKEAKPFTAKENLPPPPPPPCAKKEKQRWSKKASLMRDQVLTKNELLAMHAEQEQDEQPTVVQKVIDMRGPQVRVLTDLKGLSDEQEMEVNDVPMPELQYNVRVLVDETKADIIRLDGQLRQEQERVASLVREKEKVAKQEALQKHQLQVMETIAGVLEQVWVDDTAGLLMLRGLLKTFQELKLRHEEEFKMCSVAWIACRFAHPLLIQVFQGWQPLQNPLFGLEVMSSLKDLLQCDQPYDFSDATESMAPYVQLVSEVILPAVRISGTNSWEARDPEPMLCFLESWEQLLPPIVLHSILEHVIMPKLTAAVESWDPRREKVPIHAWVHPWLPTLGRRIETLCHSIRYKLSSVLHVWQAHDASAYALLSPWKGVFDPASWEDLIVRYIIPKLKMALQEFQINPANQKFDQFNSVMIWASAVPVSHMVHMLEVDFFSKWQQVLYHWLCSEIPDFNEITNWYKSWRGLFPPELLANKRIRMLLTAGLEMMNQAAEGVDLVQPGASENVGYLRATEKWQFDAAQQASQYPAYHSVPGATMGDMSFKESIQAYAADQGLLFMPRVNKSYNGKPVYEFGTVSIFIDSVKRLLYAQLQEGTDRWSSVSLTQLLEMNRMARSH
ncbi:septin and tuftelin-interacting protein 1 homolog 1-like [Triticum dicoccoides]|uniref:septin and tuftelin-interacting protein 1 homolog 1-like n=1 Tax=Triticum dicoccoides TaxID=85692 RepID=UPI000E7AD2BC|nr:septin and tuftelin-interacting protein 1 homolog 1-like [Triticum dicoccoides]